MSTKARETIIESLNLIFDERYKFLYIIPYIWMYVYISKGYNFPY